MTQVAFDHSGHEEIAVVVALMNSEREWLAAALGCCFEVVRPQLLFKKRISGAHIHEQAEHQGTKPCWRQRHRHRGLALQRFDVQSVTPLLSVEAAVGADQFHGDGWGDEGVERDVSFLKVLRKPMPDSTGANHW